MLTQSVDMSQGDIINPRINKNKRKYLDREYEKLRWDENLTYEEKVKRYKSGIDYMNVRRNRYSNIFPPETTRVRLEGLKNNYINANYVTIQTDGCKMEYISTQAPTPFTYRDFWKMLWDQKSSVVVMLTNFIESGQTKAHQYWNKKNIPKIFTYKLSETTDKDGFELSVVLHSKIDLDCGILRIFDIVPSNGESRRIFHIQYLSWGDHKEPSSIKDINMLIGYMELYYIFGSIVGLDGPPIVHCSAGVGRTGTFIGCSVVKRLYFRKKESDISSIVSEMRKCRNGMVQTGGQYAFIYQFREQYI